MTCIGCPFPDQPVPTDCRHDRRGDNELKTTSTHLCPAPGSGLTACCAKTPFELPIGDRITLQVDRVTCKGTQTPANDAETGAGATNRRSMGPDATHVISGCERGVL